jgi:general secretion pathway protein H
MKGAVSMTGRMDLMADGETRVRPGRCGRTPSALRGFTLLELVVVVAILGMALGLLAPDLRRSVDALRYRTAARQLAATLRHARSLAVYTKDTQVVAIDTERGIYSLSASGEMAGGEGEEGSEPEGEEKAGAAPKRTGELPPGLTVEAADGGPLSQDDDGVILVSFYPKGSSSGAGLILRGGKAGYRLDVDAVTGSVRITGVER